MQPPAGNSASSSDPPARCAAWRSPATTRSWPSERTTRPSRSGDSHPGKGAITRRRRRGVTVEAEQHAVGSDEPETLRRSLRDDQPIERVAPEQLREVADSLCVRGCHVEQGEALVDQAGRRPARNLDLPEHRLDRELPRGCRRDVHDSRPGDQDPGTQAEARAVIEHPERHLAVKQALSSP